MSLLFTCYVSLCSQFCEGAVQFVNILQSWTDLKFAVEVDARHTGQSDLPDRLNVRLVNSSTQQKGGVAVVIAEYFPFKLASRPSETSGFGVEQKKNRLCPHICRPAANPLL